MTDVPKTDVPNTNWIDYGTPESWWKRPVTADVHVQLFFGLGDDTPGLAIVKDDDTELVSLPLAEARHMVNVLIDSIVDLAVWQATTGES